MLYMNTLFVIIIYMNLWFLLALSKRNNSLVDIGWGLGFIVVVLYNFFLSTEPNIRQVIVTLLIILWGLRLSLYIFMRNKGKAEDFRYAKWRRDWGKNWLLRSYLQVFILQGLFLFTIAYPVVMLRTAQDISLGILDALGIAVWLLGFIIESVADYQKSKFKQDPANNGKVMRQGIWNYSRHPNYFGESLMWWGIFLIVLSISRGILAIFSPIIITFLLTKVSGIPLIEKHHANNPEYQEYIKTTRAFIPWLHKSNRTSGLT